MGFYLIPFDMKSIESLVLLNFPPTWKLFFHNFNLLIIFNEFSRSQLETMKRYNIFIIFAYI